MDEVNKNCHDCPHVEVIRDIYATGDSPDELDCLWGLDFEKCPMYKEEEPMPNTCRNCKFWHREEGDDIEDSYFCMSPGISLNVLAVIDGEIADAAIFTIKNFGCRFFEGKE